MEKILITGFSGFVAAHFVEFLYNQGFNYEIYGIDIHESQFDYNMFDGKLKINFEAVDMTQIQKVQNIIEKIQPDYILHLAAFSSVAYSWKYPLDSFMNNSNIFLNLINAVHNICPQCRVLSVGSSEEYGNVVHEDLPIRENQPVAPVSPYGVARVSQELLSKVFVKAYDMKIIMTRSFNHIGPRQDERFAIPSFIKQILAIKHDNKKEGEIETGDLSIIRDFVDVRDVVRAYYLLLTKGVQGEIYNIASGKGITLAEAVDIIADEVGVRVTTRTNPRFMRPSDNMEVVGSSYKIESELGWERTYTFKETIHDMIEYLDRGLSG